MASLSTQTEVFDLPELDFSLPESEVKAFQKMLAEFPGRYETAMREAVKKTRALAARELVKKFHSLTELRLSSIRQYVKTGKITSSRWGARAEIRVASPKLHLDEYELFPDSVPKSRGVSIKSRVRVRWRQRKGGKLYGDNSDGYSRLFMAEMKSGHLGAWYRQGPSKLPIHEQFGPSLQYHAYADGFLDYAEHYIQTKLRMAFAEEVGILGGFGGSRGQLWRGQR